MQDLSEYFIQNQDLEGKLLEIIENDDIGDTNDECLNELFMDSNIMEDKIKLNEFLCLLVSISKHHYRNPIFFDKIEQILLYLKKDIVNFFSNYHIFSIFKSNKRLLLFLLKENMVIFDKLISNQITKGKYLTYNYPCYFFPEINQFLSSQTIDQIAEANPELFTNNSYFQKLLNNEEIDQILVDEFENKRRIGENDNYICSLIREDMINDFIEYINQENIQLQSLTNIRQSVFETNSYLLKKSPTFFEYIMFHRSIKFFKYFIANAEIKLKDSAWPCAIHGKKTEMINYVMQNIDKKIKFPINELIKCHHNNLTDYFIREYNLKTSELQLYFLKYRNFEFIEADFWDQKDLYYFAKDNYPSLINFYINTKPNIFNEEYVHYFNVFIQFIAFFFLLEFQKM